MLMSPIAAPNSAECLDAGLRPPEDQGMDVMGPLIGVDRLEIDHVADDVELVRDAVAAMHVARHPGDVQRLAAIVALHQGDRRNPDAAALEPAAERQRPVEADGDL